MSGGRPRACESRGRRLLARDTVRGRRRGPPAPLLRAPCPREGVDPSRIGVWGLSYSGGHALVLAAAVEPRVACAVSQIPVVDGYRNMRRVHGTMAFRRFEQLLLEDRRRRFASGEGGTLPHGGKNGVVEVSTWPFPETYITFKQLEDGRRRPTRT